jgi:hypothetical protein
MSTIRRLRTLASGAAAIAALAGTAHAEVSPWYLGVLGTIEHDSNLYRVGDTQTLHAGYSYADTLFIGSLIGGLDQNIGRQHVYGSMSLNNSHFQNNSYLNNHGYSLKLGLDWAAAERLSGSILATADQNLAQLNQRTSAGEVITEKNVQNLNEITAKFALGTVTRLTLDAELGRRKRTYSATTYDYLEYDENRWVLGGHYRTSGALTLGGLYQARKTNYPRFFPLPDGSFIASQVNREDLYLTAAWDASGASNLYLRLGPTHIAYENIEALSRSEITGYFKWTWEPGARTKIGVSAYRDTGQSAQSYSVDTGGGPVGVAAVDYSSLTNALKLSADYSLTGKVSLTGSLTDTYRDLANLNVTTTPPTLAEGNDHSWIGALGLTWSPTRSIESGCNFSRERRTTNNVQVSVPLSANIFSCYGQLVLQ